MNNTHTLTTVRDWLRYSVSQMQKAELFFGHGTDNSWDESLQLLLGFLKIPHDKAEYILDAKLCDNEAEEYLTLLNKRIEQHTPVPYLLNEAWYAGLPFYVDERVLIPRSPIFQMIEQGFSPYYQGAYPERILDMCTGSGCIGIVAALAFDEADVVLADICQDALAIAHKNIEHYQLAHRISAEQSDLFSNIVGRFDIIVANPPYVDANDMAAIPNEYQHEPEKALASGELGLNHPLEILQKASDYLTDDGILVLEVGNSAEHLESLFPAIDFNWVSFEKGGIGVMVFSQFELLQYREQFDLAP